MYFNLTQYLIINVIITLVAFSITPVFRSVARKLNILDYPGGRKLQANPVAYLGGLAIIFPVTLSSLLLLLSRISFEVKLQFYLGFIVPAIIISIIGLLDDVYNLPPWPRFISQTVVGSFSAFILYLSGGGVKLFDNQLLNSVATVLWIVFIINSLNFIDNMDGLATSISIVSSFTLFILAYLNNQYLIAFLCVAIFSSCTGFLFWNRRPASIYLGDSGALYLGFLLSAISIRIELENDNQIVRIIVLSLVIAVPVFDTLQVVVSRVKKGKSPFEGGLDHISHILMSYGLSQTKVLQVIVFFSATLSGIAILLSEVV